MEILQLLEYPTARVTKFMLLKDTEYTLLPGLQVPIKLNSIALSSIGFVLVTASVSSITTAAHAQANIDQILSNSDRDLSENINRVQQLKDISPSDWSYEAVRSLAEKYGCIEGLETGTYEGNRYLTRYEYAAGLNACLEKIESFVDRHKTVSLFDLMPGYFGNLGHKDLDWEPNLANAGGEADRAESTVAVLEYNQFSTTSKLFGEAVFGLGSVLTGSTDDGEKIDRIAYFGDRITLELASSFTGKDRLSIDLEAANLPDLADVTDTFQGELAFSGSNDNSLELDLLAYTFPVGGNFKIIIGATGLAADDLAQTINFLRGDDGADGAISKFAALNPIYETAEDARIGIVYKLGETIEFSAGYLANSANEATEDSGIFNAPYGAIAQAVIRPSDRLNLAFTYIHSRDLSDANTGSDLANLRSFTEDEFNREVPTVSDSYGAEFSYELSDALVLGGWGGLSQVTTLSSLDGQIDRGTQSVWNWAINLALPDLGKEGNLGGIAIGAEPWVTSSSIDRLEDENMSLHLETFYQYRLSDNLAITPGLVWITAPDNSDRADNLVIGAIRTTFTF